MAWLPDTGPSRATVYIFAGFTVSGSSLSEMRQNMQVMDQAMKMGAPLIGINDSGRVFRGNQRWRATRDIPANI